MPAIEPRRSRCGRRSAHAGGEEGFVSVDIAHARDQRLVEQCGLDRLPRSQHLRAQGGGLDGQRIGAEATTARRS